MQDTKEELTLEEYNELVLHYREALSFIKLRLDSLNDEYRRRQTHCPIHYIQHRIKKKDSIEGKLRRRNIAISCDNAMENLTDIAGIRVICYFEEDIFTIVKHIKRQQDVLIIKECDYIQNPKQNGYRSYHVILGIPVYHDEKTEYYPVEIQIRTIAMDLWASMDHRICYKKDSLENKEVMKQYSETLRKMEDELKELYEKSNQPTIE